MAASASTPSRNCFAIAGVCTGTRGDTKSQGQWQGHHGSGESAGHIAAPVLKSQLWLMSGSHQWADAMDPPRPPASSAIPMREKRSVLWSLRFTMSTALPPSLRRRIT